MTMTAGLEDQKHDLTTSLKRLRSIISEKCVLRSDDQWLVSPKDSDYGWLIDMRQAFLDAEALQLCVEEFWRKYARLLPFQVGGLEIAAIPLVIAIILSGRQRGYDVTGFVLRKERKSHGVGKVVEGTITDAPIIVVDDIANSAETLEKTRVIVESLGRRIDHAFVVVHYGNSLANEWEKLAGVKIEYLFTLDDFGLRNTTRRAAAPKRFETIWRFQSGKANHFHVTPKSSPIVAGDKVLFGSDRGVFWALDIATSEVRWRFEIGDRYRKGIWSRPRLHRGRVYFGGYDGNLYCLDAETGSEVWRNADADSIGSSPVIDDSGRLWIGLEHGRPEAHGSIASFDADSGEKRWETFVPEFVHATPELVVSQNAIAIGANDGILRLLDADSGEIRWEFAAEGAIKEAPCIDPVRGLIYFTSFDGGIRAIDCQTGNLAWAVKTSNCLYSTPLLHRDRLFVTGTDKLLHVIDLEQHNHETVALTAKSVSSPVLIGDSVFFGSNAGSIIECDQHGRIIGRHQITEPMTARVAFDPDTQTFFALNYMNELYAFRRAPEPAGA